MQPSPMREGREPLRYASFYYSVLEPRFPGSDNFKSMLFFYQMGLVTDDIVRGYFSDQIPVFEEFCEELREEMKHYGAFLESRVKDPSEILKKTLACERSNYPTLPSEKGPSVPTVYINDVFAARVVIPEVEEVYDILVPFFESRFSAVPKNRDYIKSPKPRTGYQSYHMDIWVPYKPGFVVEMQLRAYDMHKKAIKDKHWKKGCARKPPRRIFKRLDDPKQAGRNEEEDRQMSLLDLMEE